MGSPGGEHNIYVIWRRLLDENEKIAKARLAAVQVYQESISDDAKVQLQLLSHTMIMFMLILLFMHH